MKYVINYKIGYIHVEKFTIIDTLAKKKKVKLKIICKMYNLFLFKI